MDKPLLEDVQRVALWRQIVPALLINMNGLSVGLGLSFTSVAAASMVSEGVLTEEQRSIFTSIYLLAAAVGCLLAGPLLGRFGRKLTSIVMAAVSVISWVMIGGASNGVLQCLGRFLAGISRGLTSLAVTTYVVEITTERFRGMLGVVYGAMISAGILINLVLGAVVPWRYLAVLGASISAAVLLGTLMLPESPRWLLLRNRPDEARTELLRLRGGRQEDIFKEYTDMERSSDSSSLSSTSSSLSISTLLRPRYLKPILLSGAVNIVQRLPGVVIIVTYLDVFLGESGWKDNLSTPTIAAGVALFVTGILSIWVVAVLGRRLLLLVNLLILTVLAVIIGCVYYFQHMLDTNTYKWLSLVLVFMYFIAYSLGVGPVCAILKSELLPNRIRAPVGSCALPLSFALGFVMTQSYPYILHVVFQYGIFWMLAAINFCCFLAMYFFLPETNNLSLEEIEMQYLEAEGP